MRRALMLMVITLIYGQQCVFADMSPAREYLSRRRFELSPYEFIDTDYAYKGFNVDLHPAIAEAQGFDVEIIPMPWADAEKALKMRRRCIQGMTKSRTGETYDFQRTGYQFPSDFCKEGPGSIMSLKISKGNGWHTSGDVSKTIYKAKDVDAMSLKTASSYGLSETGSGGCLYWKPITGCIF